MSCGPSEKLKELADKVQAAEDKFDAAVNSSPLGKINDIKNDALDTVNGVMGKMENMFPSIINKVLSPANKTLHDDVKDLLKFVILGHFALPQIKNQLDYMKEKWGNVDLGDIRNFDDLHNLLMSGAIDLDSLCKLVPNIEKEGVEITVKGVPTSFPDIDPAAILKGGKLPPVVIGEIEVDVGTRAKEEAEEFLNLELPDFDY